MQILVLCDDRWHPANIVHEGLMPLTHKGYEFEWIESVAGWSVEQIFEYPVVLLTKSNNISASDESPWMTSTNEQAFTQYVQGGRGLLAVHSGTAGYEKNTVLRRLLGGVFVSHPEQCPVTTHVQTGHPLTEGSDSFIVKDEHYVMELDDPQAEVFMTTTSEHGEQPGGWTRTEGKGRVCVLTPGHNLEVWQHPSFQTLLHNALRWCGNVTL